MARVQPQTQSRLAWALPNTQLRRGLLVMLLLGVLLVLRGFSLGPRGVRATYSRFFNGGIGCNETSLVWVLLSEAHQHPYLMESFQHARVYNPTEMFYLVAEPRFLPSDHSWLESLHKHNVRIPGMMTIFRAVRPPCHTLAHLFFFLRAKNYFTLLR